MKNNIGLPLYICFLLMILSIGILSPASGSTEEIRLSSGQTVYVPIYSHIYSGVKVRPFDLAATHSGQGISFVSRGQVIAENH